MAASGGTIGGLLNVRGVNDASNTSAFDANGPIVEIASRVEAITRDLLARINTTYLGPDRDAGTAGHQPSSVDLNGNPPSVYGLFTFQYTGARDVDANGLPDDFAALGVAGIDNFSSILQLAISAPEDVAAGLDHSGNAAGAMVVAPGDGRNLTALSALQAQNASTLYGPISLSGTLEDSYNVTVGRVGNLRARSSLNLKLAEDEQLVVQSRRDEFSGVSLDEEFTQLIKFQKAFEASAKLIRIADELLEQLVNLI